MAKEICISSTPHETRLAILEDDQLAEIYYERENEYTLAGSIYNGRVTRVLPGMQSAFVDLGLERDAFLYVTDFMELEDSEETDELEKAAAASPTRLRARCGTKTAEASRTSARAGKDNNGRIGRPEIAAQRKKLRRKRPASPRPVSSHLFSRNRQARATRNPRRAVHALAWTPSSSRRSRSGRPGPEGQPESRQSLEITPEPTAETEIAPEIQASASQVGERPSFGSAPHAPRPTAHIPVPFVLPGESLSKYGGTAAEETAKAAPDDCSTGATVRLLKAIHAD